MGCNSDYMNPTDAERNSKETCEHIVYLGEKLGQPVPQWAEEAAGELYGNTSKLNEAVVLLCQMCRVAHADIIYNGRDPKARALADWWDDHQLADQKRNKAELAESLKAELQAQALSKLTEEERKALGF